MAFIERPYCEVTGAPFNVEFGVGAVSAGAIANPPHYTRARSATMHSDVARTLVTRLKYGDRTDLAPWMANWMIRAGSELIDETDIVASVPLHRLRYFMRRYNQSAELARTIARKRKIDFAPEILVRVRPTKQQVGLSERQRQDNVRGAFVVPEASEILVNGRNILLVDDVLTTGATVNAAARALFSAGAAKVNVLTFSQVVPTMIEPGAFNLAQSKILFQLCQPLQSNATPLYNRRKLEKIMADVTIYTRKLCGFCTAAKSLLQNKGVSFTEYDATFDPALKKEMIQKSDGGSTFPQIFIGDIHVGGCDDLMALERSGKLDSLLRV